MIKNNLFKLISKKKATVAIIGLGYVGLPLAILIAKKGFNILGIDKDKKRIYLLKKGNSYFDRISNEDVKKLKKKATYSSNYNLINKADIIIICVPTPLSKGNKPDLSFIRSAVESIKKKIRGNQIIILESTSYPGTTFDEIINKINKKFTLGKNIFVGFSSERINPGFNENKIYKVPKVVSGYTKNCRNLINLFYSKIFLKTVLSKTIEIAEFSKLLENIYRSVNIGFINEMKIIADKMKMDIYEIIKIAKTKPFGFRPFAPGPGVGGHCIPIDPYYLYWKAKKENIIAKFIQLSAKTNEKIINFIISKVHKVKKEIKKKKLSILLIGLSYKKDVDDIRESATLKVFKKLYNEKHTIFYHDNLVKNFKIRGFKKLIKINKNSLKKFDLVIIMTDHSYIDYKKILDFSEKIIDTRGRFKISKKVMRA